MEATEESWYIVKRPSNHCEIVLEQDLVPDDDQANMPLYMDPKLTANSEQGSLEKWGPFKAKNQAIAKRIGLIRAGKCQPL